MRNLLSLSVTGWALLCGAPIAASGSPFESSPVQWRAYGQAAFDEATDSDRRVFLVLTAPWTWDHFLLADRLFHDPDVVERLNDRWVPVLADASIYPELRGLYRIRSGLLPSFHFLNSRGRPVVSFPPMGAEELVYYLDEYATSPPEPVAPPAPEPVLLEFNAKKLTNRLGRLLLDLYEKGDRALPVVHDDLDFSDLHFLSEYGRVRLRTRSRTQLDRDTTALLASALFDREAGGVHRSAALDDQSAVHYEKVLRQNAEAGAVLAAWSRMGGRSETGLGALAILRWLNDSLRTGNSAIYLGSQSADVFDRDGHELVMEGRQYYSMNWAARRRVGTPFRTAHVPLGANFVMQQTLVQYFRTWGDDRMTEAVGPAGRELLEGGFEPDGTARRLFAKPGTGNLRDQADAGSGLLAYHAVTGDPDAIVAATRLAEALLSRFRNDGGFGFRNVPKGSGLGAFVESAPLDPAWNGAALRFLVELGRVTGDPRWWRIARSDLNEWAERIPADGTGAGELGRAALRAERTLALVLVDAEPGTEEATRLMQMALRVTTPICLLRWLPADEREEIAARFDVELESEPAVYLVWAGESSALRTARDLRGAWVRGINRIW